MEFIHYGGMMAIILSILLALGPHIRAQLDGHSIQVASFGGGIAISYVFFILFPEVEHSREWLGTSVYSIIVLSLLVFLALELLLS